MSHARASCASQVGRGALKLDLILWLMFSVQAQVGSCPQHPSNFKLPVKFKLVTGTGRDMPVPIVLLVVTVAGGGTDGSPELGTQAPRLMAPPRRRRAVRRIP
jgi:hypothetical protein